MSETSPSEVASARRAGSRVAVLVLTLHVTQALARAIRSVAGDDRVQTEIHLLLNGADQSSRERAAALLAGIPALSIAQSPRNLGFTGGVNFLSASLDRSRFDYLFLLNDDAVMRPGALARLVDVLNARPQAAVAGPRILCASAPGVIDNDGVLTWPWFFQHRVVNQGRSADDCPAGAPHEVPFVPGTCMLIRARAFADLGGMDSRLFAYFEDWDFCLRARAAGMSCLHVPAAEAEHEESSTLGNRSRSFHFLMTRNRWLTARSHLPIAVFVGVFIPYFLVSRVLLKSLLLLGKRGWGGILGVWQGLAYLALGRAAPDSWWPLPNSEPPRGPE